MRKDDTHVALRLFLHRQIEVVFAVGTKIFCRLSQAQQQCIVVCLGTFSDDLVRLIDSDIAATWLIV
jgi:hypothetical protein